MVPSQVEKKVRKMLRSVDIELKDTFIVFDRLTQYIAKQVIKTPVRIIYHAGLKKLDPGALKTLQKAYPGKRTFFLLPVTIDARIDMFFKRPFQKTLWPKNVVFLYAGVTREELLAYAQSACKPFPRILDVKDPLDGLVKDFPSVRHAFGKALGKLQN